ncbi:hypothetical protein As57867_022445, partial [Aphanomyces stellatus]
MADICKIGMDVLADAYQSDSTFTSCPPSVATYLRDFKIDLANHTGLCNIPGCWSMFESVVEFKALKDGDCLVKDIATNKVVPVDQIKCAIPTLRPTVTPAPTQTGPSATQTSTLPNPVFLPSSTSASAPLSAHAPSNSVVTIGVIAAVIVVVLLGALAFWRFRGRKRRQDLATTAPHIDFHVLEDPKQFPSQHTSGTGTTEHKSTGVMSSIGGLSGDDDMELLTMWNLPPQDLELKKRLAEGAFGEVWLATYLGENVAVKTLLKHRSSLKDVKVFIEEIKLMAKMADCPAIVQFVGVSFHRIIDIKLVTEFMGGGDLRSVLQASDDVSFPLLQKVECALRVADALVFLHTMDPKVIHRDLKSRNVLMDAEKGAKVTDFGVSREAIDEETLT